jgi:hypothetical protein
MLEILEAYLNFIWSTFQYDMEVFSQGWMYYWLLIPAVFYFIFFFIKWAVITAPIWLPVRLFFNGIGSIFHRKK